MVSSERVIEICPPVVEYDAGFQAKAAEEVLQLTEGSVLVEMLSEYTLLREQVRACFDP